MRVMKAVVLVMLCLVLNSACVHTESEVLKEEMASASPVEASSPTLDFTVLNENGWEIPGLKDSVAGKQRIRGDNPRITVTNYSARDANGKHLKLAASFFTDDERRTLRLHPNLNPLVISSIGKQDFDGKTYCYTVVVYPEGIGADMFLFFYDMDGDGRFETATTRPHTPDLPNWVN